MKNKILLVEDEASLAMLIQDNLKIHGYEVLTCPNGKEGLEAFFEFKPDLLLLDVMMPMVNGFTVAKTIRNTDRKTPILFLTAKIQTKDVVKGFESGGNDYIRKPFGIDELLVRIKALLSPERLLNKPEADQIHNYIIGSFQLNSLNFELINHKGTVKKLTSKEAALLKLFAQNINTTLTKESILLNVWGTDSFFSSRSLDVFISRLRKYLKDDNSIKLFNIRGIGYKFILNK